jgi:2-hydroxy-6-oxonona-2,4-dienedioate hydrolase
MNTQTATPPCADNAPSGPVDGPTTTRLVSSAYRTETQFDPADGTGRLVWHGWNTQRDHGRPIVLLHGGAGSWRHWMRAIPHLATYDAVWAPDLPGLGESDMPPMPYDPDRVAGIIAAGLRQILRDADGCDLVGFSFGAIAAGHVAANHPALVRTLTLVGAGALGVARAPITLVPVRNKTGAERRDANRTNLLQLMIADPDRIDDETLNIQDWNTSRARVSSVGFAGSSLLLDALRRVSCPIGAIWGEHDHAARPLLDSRIAAIRSIQADAPVVVIPGAGHWVSHEAPRTFNATLDGILRQLRARPAAGGS